MKRYKKFLLLGTLLVFSLALPQVAHAWKPITHVYLAEQALNDALDDFFVTIYRVDYDSGQVLEKLGDYPVDPDLAVALRSAAPQFRAGVLGPDAYPDLLTGQEVIHPDNSVGGSNGWLQFLWDRSHNLPSTMSGAQKRQIQAFVFGFMSHAAGDMFAHTYINHYAGGDFALGHDAVKHVVMEGYMGKRTPAVASYDASIAGVDGFIYDNTINAVPSSKLDKELLMGAGSVYSVPRVYSTLRATLQADRDKSVNPLWIKYEDAWIKDIDDGLKAWPALSHQIALAIEFNPDGACDINQANQLTNAYWSDHLRAMTLGPAPNEIGLAADLVTQITTQVLGVLVPDPVRAVLKNMTDAILDLIIETTFGMTTDEMKEYLTDPERYFNEVLGPGSAGAGGQITLADFNTKELKIAGNPGETFDWQKFVPAYNTVTMIKLMMLSPAGMNKLLADLGSTLTLDTPNVMLGFVRKLDGSNQWNANSQKMLIVRAMAYDKIFMKEPDALPLPTKPQKTLTVTLNPMPVLEQQTALTVVSVDSTTHAPIAGDVVIRYVRDPQEPASFKTNTKFTYTFKSRAVTPGAGAPTGNTATPAGVGTSGGNTATPAGVGTTGGTAGTTTGTPTVTEQPAPNIPLGPGELGFGTWVQLVPTYFNLRTVSAQIVPMTEDGKAAGEDRAYLRLQVAIKNPNPSPWGVFQNSSLSWEVQDDAKNNVAGITLLYFTATGEFSGGYTILPGQQLNFTYYINIPANLTPSAIVVKLNDATRRIPLVPSLLNGVPVTAQPGDAPGVNQIPGKVVTLGTWHYCGEEMKNAINVRSVEYATTWADGKPLADGMRVIRFHIAIRNDFGAAWRFFNLWTFEMNVFDADEQTLNREIHMFEPDGKPADSYEFDKGQLREFILDFGYPESGHPAKLMIDYNHNFALRYMLSTSGAPTTTPTAGGGNATMLMAGNAGDTGNADTPDTTTNPTGPLGGDAEIQEYPIIVTSAAGYANVTLKYQPATKKWE